MLFMANGVTMLHAQYRFDNILYGAAYYHEYMPSERLDEDIRLMKEYGVNVVRVGESSWGYLSRKREFSSLNGWIGYWIKCMKPV